MKMNVDAGPKTALVVGATGVVGSALVRQLCEMRPDYGRVLAWTRRPLHYSHPKLFVEEEVDFDRMDKMPPERVQDIYCTLGTTLKQAGSEEEFLHVDVGYPRLLAKWGRKAGAQCFVLLSAPWADTQSRSFYLRAKGMAEDAVRGARFRSFIIVRSPLIDGQREDFRPAELLGISLFQLFGNVLPQQLEKWRPMSGGAIASAILSVTQNPQAGEQVIYPYETQLPPRADPIED